MLSAWALFIPLAWVAFGIGGFDPVDVIAFLVQGGSWRGILWSNAGDTRLALIALVPLLVGAALFLFVASALTTAMRAVRSRDLRTLAFSLAPLGLPAVIFLVGYCDLGELQIGFDGFAPAQLFARLLTFSMGSMTSSSAPGAPVVLMATLSWLALVVSIGLVSWCLKRARGRVGLARRFLRSESIVAATTAVAMSFSWIVFVIWGIASLSGMAGSFCLVCSEAGIAQPSGPPAGVAFWVVVACMGVVTLRASVAAQRSFRRSPELSGSPG